MISLIIALATLATHVVLYLDGKRDRQETKNLAQLAATRADRAHLEAAAASDHAETVRARSNDLHADVRAALAELPKRRSKRSKGDLS